MFLAGALKVDDEEKPPIDPWETYGAQGAIILYVLRLLTLLTLPQVIFNFAGLLLFNAFPGKVKLKGSPLLAPFICIRVVTRGDFPQLVRDNVTRNMNLCIDVGMENFMIEVVTDKVINLPKHARVREVVVPSEYKTKSGALFKSRALQYCLEDGVNMLSDTDWIVHLDEETLLTENSVRGILNFVFDGQYQFGQGLITYANEHVVNWLTTLADSFRVSDDMGKLRFQFYVIHKPLFSWKGSYVVTQVGAERKVSFDNGLDGSVAEDCYFAMKAYVEGYSFNFIEGEMWEKSPFTLWDFMQQRKRWLQVDKKVITDLGWPFPMKLHHLPLFVTGLVNSNVVALISDDLREGRPTAALNEGNISAVRLMVQTEKETYQQIRISFGFGMSQVHQIFHEHLVVRKSCTLWIRYI
ncbi:Beta-1,4-mannosyltransferase egh [Eumeta japonica]|uniref:Beta-1,4-mannosyltransferase egh n=1 Tax=Eumeta variegata TaxID=151549 RepID=A0A4C1VL40_EUMVA|nr:Beta-1,4-mannosyltransferase egh [Eumeta japonica]